MLSTCAPTVLGCIRAGGLRCFILRTTGGCKDLDGVKTRRRFSWPQREPHQRISSKGVEVVLYYFLREARLKRTLPPVSLRQRKNYGTLDDCPQSDKAPSRARRHGTNTKGLDKTTNHHEAVTVIFPLMGYVSQALYLALY